MIASTTRLPNTYSTAITGTIFSVTEAMRRLPPRKMNAAAAATSTPINSGGV